jgi:hypothetical protein
VYFTCALVATGYALLTWFLRPFVGNTKVRLTSVKEMR